MTYSSYWPEPPAYHDPVIAVAQRQARARQSEQRRERLRQRLREPGGFLSWLSEQAGTAAAVAAAPSRTASAIAVTRLREEGGWLLQCNRSFTYTDSVTGQTNSLTAGRSYASPDSEPALRFPENFHTSNRPCGRHTAALR